MKRYLIFPLFLLLAACDYSAPVKPVQIQIEEPGFDLGKTDKENGIYTNKYFNLQLKFNPDWKVQSKEDLNQILQMSKDVVFEKDDDIVDRLEAGQINSANLLAMYKYDLGTPVGFNPSFLVIAENTAQFKGIKNGRDYLYHAKQLMKRTKLNYEFEKKSYRKKISNHDFFVMEAKAEIMGNEFRQDYITTLKDGFCLSFILSYSDERERQDLYRILKTVHLK